MVLGDLYVEPPVDAPPFVDKLVMVVDQQLQPELQPKHQVDHLDE